MSSYYVLLRSLIFFAVLLILNLSYLFLKDSKWPINTVKITSTYKHLSRKQIEEVISSQLSNASFFSLPQKKLYLALNELAWVENVKIQRTWPDILRIKITEYEPFVQLNDMFVTKDGRQFKILEKDTSDFSLPKLISNENQNTQILQIYQKLSKLLENYDFKIALLKMHDNNSVELLLTNGISINLGCHNLEERMSRFCRAYPAIFSSRIRDLAKVDLRYNRGMAVLWKQSMEK